MKCWPTKPLGELLLTLETGSRPKGGVGEISDGIPSVSGEHINREGEFYWDTPKHITRDFYARMKRGRIQRGDILVVKDGATTGKTAMVRDNFPFHEAAINEHVFLLRTDQTKALPKFVGYFLFGPVGQQQILSSYRGAAIGGIAQDFVRKVHIPLAPLAEQERLVKLLDEADELRKLRAQADRRTAALTPALFHEMFGDPTTSERRWHRVRLCDVSGIIVPTRDKPKRFVGTVPWVTLPDLNGLFIGESKNQLTHEDAREVSNRLMPERTVMLSCAGTLGKVAIAAVELYANQQFYGLTPNPAVLDSVFLAVCLQMKGEEFFSRLAGTSTLGFFSKQKALDIEIVLPPLPLQQEFAQRVSEIRELEAGQAASRLRLENLFQSLLYRAFNGEI